MKLSTGKVAFPVEFDNGEKAVIYFNPNDRGIQERVKTFEALVDKRVKEINLDKYRSKFESNLGENIDLSNPEKLLDMSMDELLSLNERMGAINEIEAEYNNAVKVELNNVFNSDISTVAFRYCEPFDMVVVQDENGDEKNELYIMHFIRWLMCELKKYGDKSKGAMNKHLDKYSK